MNRPASESAKAIASNVRAELARREIPKSALMPVVELTYDPLALRLSGEVPFTTDQLAAVAAFLDMEVWELWPRQERVS